eukprot:gene28233-35055_t
MSEAYYLETGDYTEDMALTLAWFNNAANWLTMGTVLESTPFILLCEDSFWEAFTRSPLEIVPLSRLVNSMLKSYRKNDVPALLAKAMDVNPWNTYCRDMLCSYEIELVSDVSQRQWNNMFYSEYRTLSKIQAQMRGFIARKKWPVFRCRVLEIRNAFQSMISVADRSYATAKFNQKYTLYLRWRMYVYNWMWLKYNSATRIQSWFRKIWCVYCYAWSKWRVQRANSMFVVAAQRSYDFNRIRPFMKWHALFTARRRVHSATLIVKALQMTGFSSILAKACEFLLTVLKVARKHANMRLWKQWRGQYLRRRRLHAKISIRFWIREMITLREI